MIAFLRQLMVFAAWLLTGLRAEWVGATPQDRQRIYFGNHRSHGDFVLIFQRPATKLATQDQAGGGQ